MIFKFYNRTFLGGCNRNKRFPNSKYRGYTLSYCNNKQNTHILGTYKSNQDDCELWGYENGCGILNYTRTINGERL